MLLTRLVLLPQAKAATPPLGRGSLAAAFQSAKASEEAVDWRAEGRAAAGNAEFEPSAPPSRFERMKVSWCCKHQLPCTHEGGLARWTAGCQYQGFSPCH